MREAAAPDAEAPAMRTVGSSTLRGGQTVFHGLRMWGQMLRAGIFVSVIAVVAFPGWHIWHRTTGYEWYAAGIVTVAEAKLVFGYSPDARQEVRLRDGRVAVLTITEIAASPLAIRARERLRDQVFASAIRRRQGVAGRRSCCSSLLFWYRGWQLNRAKRLRGAELTTCPAVAPAHPPALGARCAGRSRSTPRRRPTGSPACRIRSAPRPSTPSSRAPPGRARRC